MYRDLQRTCRAIVLLIESLLNDVHFAVAVYIVKEEAARRGDDRRWVGVVLVFFFFMGGCCDKTNHISPIDFIKRFSLLSRDTNLLVM